MAGHAIGVSAMITEARSWYPIDRHIPYYVLADGIFRRGNIGRERVGSALPRWGELALMAHRLVPQGAWFVQAHRRTWKVLDYLPEYAAYLVEVET